MALSKQEFIERARQKCTKREAERDLGRKGRALYVKVEIKLRSEETHELVVSVLLLLRVSCIIRLGVCWIRVERVFDSLLLKRFG